MSTVYYKREYLHPGMVDPVPILKAHLDADTVDAMLRKGK
jgi:hypothetical protein